MYIFRHSLLLIVVFLVGCNDAAQDTASDNNPINLDIVNTLNPINNQSDVARNETVYLTFKEILQSPSASDDLIVLDSYGNRVIGSIQQPDNKTVAFTPEQPFRISETYLVRASSTIQFSNNMSLGKLLEWKFTVRDGTWGNVSPIGINNTVQDEVPQLYSPKDDSLFLTWERTNDSGILYLFSREYVYGSNIWGAAKTTLVGNTNLNGYEFKFNDNGDGALTWMTRSLTKDAATFTSYKRYNGSWQAAIPIANGSFSTKTTNTLPSLALTQNNNIALAWYSSVPGPNISNYTSLVSRHIDINGIETDKTLRVCGNDFFVHNCSSPVIDILSNGDTIGSYMAITSIVSQTYNGADWIAAGTVKETFNYDPKRSARTPLLATGPNDISTMVWLESADGHQIWANRRTGSGANSWGNAIPLDELNPNNISAEAPHLTLSSNGHVAVIWEQLHNTSGKQIWSNIFSNGSWSGPTRIDTASGDTTLPQIAIDAQGYALAVWQQISGTNSFIWVSRYANGTWQSPVQLSENIDTDASNPSIILRDSGEARAVWAEDDGTSFNLVEKVFN